MSPPIVNHVNASTEIVGDMIGNSTMALILGAGAAAPVMLRSVARGVLIGRPVPFAFGSAWYAEHVDGTFLVDVLGPPSLLVANGLGVAPAPVTVLARRGCQQVCGAIGIALLAALATAHPDRAATIAHRLRNGRPRLGQTRRPVSGRPVTLRVCGLPNFDQMSVRIADVATDLVLVLLRRCQELSTSGAPFGVHGRDVFDPDVEEAADAVEITWCLEGDRGLVVGRASANIDDDPTVGQCNICHPSGEDHPAAEHLSIEAPRALDIARDDEVG
jgi:hypothetical protein